MAKGQHFQLTDRAIQQALIRLLKTKPFEKITVQNILDETPITRGAFYHHYHDKYEIVEKMLEEFLGIQERIKSDLLANDPTRFPELIQKSFQEGRELMETLLKVHTEKVDLQKTLANQLEQQYLATVDSPSKQAEATLYAHAMTAFQLSYLNVEKADFSSAYVNHVFISVMLQLLGLYDDEEVWEFLLRKMDEKP